MKILSILICSVPVRIESYAKLIAELTKQVNELNAGELVQIISLTDTKEITVGEKRNLLKSMSAGEYVCFIDDDDMVSPDYLSVILQGLQSKPDAFVFKLKANNYTIIFGKEFYDTPDGKVRFRPVSHLCPVKRVIANRISFPHINYAEDARYAELIRPLITTIGSTDKVLYLYNDVAYKSQTAHNRNTAYKEH